jgi:hypothetical protein
MQNEGLRNNRDDTRTTGVGVETEDREAAGVSNRYLLQSTIGSYEVEEIDGGRLGLWILSHRRERYRGKATPRVASD